MKADWLINHMSLFFNNACLFVLFSIEHQFVNKFIDI